MIPFINMLSPKIEKKLDRIMKLILAITIAYSVFVVERIQNQPRIRTPTILNAGEGLKILTKLRKEGNPTLARADLKPIQKTKEAIDEAKQALDNGDTQSCSDWLITAKGELEKAKDKSLLDYHLLLGEEIKEVRLALAVSRKK